jgi:hypothetical protein
MKKLGFATVVASGVIAGMLGATAPALADIGHHDWVVDQIGPTVVVPQVDTTVRHSPNPRM